MIIPTVSTSSPKCSPFYYTHAKKLTLHTGCMLVCMYNARRSSKNCKIEPNIPIRPREANNSQMPSAEFDYPIQITITVELHILVG